MLPYFTATLGDSDPKPLSVDGPAFDAIGCTALHDNGKKVGNELKTVCHQPVSVFQPTTVNKKRKRTATKINAQCALTATNTNATAKSKQINVHQIIVLSPSKIYSVKLSPILFR